MLDPSRHGHAHAERRLRSEAVAWLTTVRADGQAQASPVWFLWDEGTATVEPDTPRADRVDGYLAKYQAAIEALGYEPGPFARTYSTPIRVHPTRVRAW